MSAKSIREYDGKRMLSRWLEKHQNIQPIDVVQILPSTILSTLPSKHPWLLNTKLVVKPDQLIKRRGKSGLIKLNATWEEVQQWVEERRDKEVKVTKHNINQG